MFWKMCNDSNVILSDKLLIEYKLEGNKTPTTL